MYRAFTWLVLENTIDPIDRDAVLKLLADARFDCGERDGEASARSDPGDVARFVAETGVDAVAVSVGNVHLQRERTGGLDEARVRAIEAVTTVPLVIHGGSGVPAAQRTHLARTSNIAKFNIGTELRMAWGAALRAAVAADPARFDRTAILRDTEAPTRAAARRVIAAIHMKTAD